MRYKILFSGFLFCMEFLAFVSLSCAASGSQKLKITYSSLNGAYAPFWIAVEEGLGRKYGLDLEFLAFVSLSCAASGSQKLKITYSSLNGAYAPFWIAVEEGLGRKYGLDLEAIY